MMQTDNPSPAGALQSIFGFPAFRAGQVPVVNWP